MFAGNIPGKTQTIPTAIYMAIDASNMQLAWTLVVITIGMSLVFLLCIQLINKRIITLKAAFSKLLLYFLGNKIYHREITEFYLLLKYTFYLNSLSKIGNFLLLYGGVSKNEEMKTHLYREFFILF